MVRDILAQGRFHDTQASARDRAIAIGEVTEELLDPCFGLLKLLDEDENKREPLPS